MHFVIVKISEISTPTIKPFIYIYFFLFFFPQFSLAFYFTQVVSLQPMTPKSDDLRAPDEKISLGLKESSKQGHKTQGDYLFLLTTVKREKSCFLRHSYPALISDFLFIYTIYIYICFMALQVFISIPKMCKCEVHTI